MRDERRRRAVRICAVIFIAAWRQPAIGAFNPVNDQLPEDIREAHLRLEEGTLDSNTWDVIRNFYDDPLSVPLGELRYLDDVMPCMGGDLPVSGRELSKYEPWDEQSVARFFRDYPYLASVRPILSFDVRALPRVGVVRFGSSTRSVDAAARQSVRFDISPLKHLSVNGGADFESNHARWSRRRVCINAPSYAQFQLGNFSLRPSDGLVFGYFPVDRSLDEDVRDNWLYGNAGTWNGACISVSSDSLGRLDAFLHHRPSESVVGGQAGWNAVRWLTILAGGAGLDAREGNGAAVWRDTSYAFWVSARVVPGRWAAEAMSGFLSGAVRYPVVVLSARTGLKGAQAEARVIRLPEEYRAGRSRLVHDAQKALGLDDSTREDITGVDLTCAESFTAFLRYSFSMTYLIAHSRSMLRARWGIDGSGPFDYSVRYYYQPPYGEGAAAHKAYIAAGWRLMKKVAMEVRGDFYMKENAYRRMKLTCEPGLDAAPALAVFPSVSYAVTGGGENDVVIGCRQRLSLFEKTVGELEIAVPLMAVEEEGIIIYANSNFLF